MLHGLRGTAVLRLRRAGVSKPLICDFVGMSAQMVDRYCRKSEQRENALAAVYQLEKIRQERTAERVKNEPRKADPNTP